MKHLVIRDPWTMPYFQYEQQSIDELNREIGPEHPLYRKRLYVTAVRRDPTAVIFETVAEKSIYALVYLTYSGKRGKRTTYATMHRIYSAFYRDKEARRS
jgi:hypothetical protein